MNMNGLQNIKSMIYKIRGYQVMLDADLAKIYQVETKVLNQAVKRNIDRFPPEFMFRLTQAEYDNLMSQFATSSWGYAFLSLSILFRTASQWAAMTPDTHMVNFCA